jgi:hypothetical protein
MTLPGGFESSYRAPYQGTPSRELMEDINGMPGHVVEALKLRARKDRYFLAKGVLGYQDVSPFTHGPLCRALENREKKRRMFLMPRGHLKTTLATITDSVGNAIDDPEESRTLIVNEIEDNAIGFLSEIKAHFENNEILHKLFPELIPQRFGGPGSKWSGARACLNRSTAYKEWTWTAAGVGKSLTGNHFNVIKCDDLIGFEARESPANMRYAISFAKSIEPLLINMDEDLIDFIGTRWSIHDLYREMLNAYGDDMAYFAREDIENDEMGNPQPIFPRKFSLKKLHRLSQIDPILYYAQFKNNPIADGLKDFNYDKVRFFDFDQWGNVVYRDENGYLQRWGREQLDVVMTCDPNSGELTAQDLPAIEVVAQSPKDQLFIFDSWARRVEPDKFVEQIFDMWSHWQPRVLGIEKAAQQTTKFYFKKLTKERGVYVNLIDLKPKNRIKTEFIRKTLQPVINTGRFFVRKSQTGLQHQIKFHPDLNNDDEINCAAYATEILSVPASRKELQEEEDAAERVLAARNPTTGY